VLGTPIVLPGELETTGGRLYARDGRRRRRIDAIYRRLDEDRLSSADGAPTPLGELLLPAIEAGRLGVVNAFGTGLADDKLAHAYVGAMIRFYLGEEPLLDSVATIDPADSDGRAGALEEAGEMVIKPRDGFGGHGVTILARASAAERRRALGRLGLEPSRFVIQARVPISSHPTVCGGRLRPRRVDLRPFVVSEAGRQTAMTGGLSRFAQGAGELVVNSSRGGGCKDTWVVDE
jgi:carboxylate-amine ligase